jgi:hypothetical protein
MDSSHRFMHDTLTDLAWHMPKRSRSVHQWFDSHAVEVFREFRDLFVRFSATNLQAGRAAKHRSLAPREA